MRSPHYIMPGWKLVNENANARSKKYRYYVQYRVQYVISAYSSYREQRGADDRIGFLFSTTEKAQQARCYAGNNSAQKRKMRTS